VLASLRRAVAERDASSLISPIGRSAAITFQVASDDTSSRFSQASCVSEDESSRCCRRACSGGIAIAAHVDQEDVEQRAVADLA